MTNTTKFTQNALKYKVKTYTTRMTKIQGPKEGKPILKFTNKSGFNLGP